MTPFAGHPQRSAAFNVRLHVISRSPEQALNNLLRSSHGLSRWTAPKIPESQASWRSLGQDCIFLFLSFQVKASGCNGMQPSRSEKQRRLATPVGQILRAGFQQALDNFQVSARSCFVQWCLPSPGRGQEVQRVMRHLQQAPWLPPLSREQGKNAKTCDL